MNHGEPATRLIDGRFELLRRLGGGGMGLVWLARDTALDREVALKEVRPPDPAAEAADPEAARQMRERVLREARALARLQHPNVVTIHHIVDTPEHPYPWLVMELVSGGSLAERLEAGPLTPAEAAHIGRGVLAALRAAHAAGIQHRDVKPGNVLLRPAPDGGPDTPVLTDFGIAAVHGATALTMTGALIGSPEYIAPERIRGQEGDPASDVWSLGMMLYVAVEGSHPLRRGSTLATLAAVLDEPLPPPVRAGALAPVLAAVLAKDPAARPDPSHLDTLLAAASAGAVRGTPPPGATGHTTGWHLAAPAGGAAAQAAWPGTDTPAPGGTPAPAWPGTPDPAQGGSWPGTPPPPAGHGTPDPAQGGSWPGTPPPPAGHGTPDPAAQAGAWPVADAPPAGYGTPRPAGRHAAWPAPDEPRAAGWAPADGSGGITPSGPHPGRPSGNTPAPAWPGAPQPPAGHSTPNPAAQAGAWPVTDTPPVGHGTPNPAAQSGAWPRTDTPQPALRQGAPGQGGWAAPEGPRATGWAPAGGAAQAAGAGGAVPGANGGQPARWGGAAAQGYGASGAVEGGAAGARWAPRPGRRRRGTTVALSVTAVLLAGVLIWAMGHGRNRDDSAGNGTPGTVRPPASAAGAGKGTGKGGNPGSTSAAEPPAGQTPDIPAAGNLLTPAGVRSAVAALTPHLRDHRVKQLVVYSQFASAEAPTKADASLYDQFVYRDGDVTSSPGGTMSSDDGTVDLRQYDWNVLPGLLSKATKTLNVPHPTMRYIIVGPDLFTGAPTISVYLTDGYGAGYLSATPRGKITRTYPRGS
ncbi:serine/threonine-protein kinase [Actinacidiphila acididurans]|uniref:serine/threonine-protein kinase n=1 Tax=Actinacidiphila acididurans TaxID=2784346 RepID=UPI00355897C5